MLCDKLHCIFLILCYNNIEIIALGIDGQIENPLNFHSPCLAWGM